MFAPTVEPLVGAGDCFSFRDVLERLASEGYQWAQFSATQPGMRPRELDHSARRDLMSTLRRRGLAVAGLDFWIPPSHFLDPGRVDRAVSAFKQALDLAGELGRCPTSCCMPSSIETSQAGEFDAVVRDIAEYADRVGVLVADHAVADRAPSADALGFGLDPAAWLGRGGDPVAAAHRNAQRLVSVRLCDLLTSGLRAPVGDEHQGQLDVLAYKAALAVSGYQRPIVIDVRQWSDPWPGLQQTRSAWDVVGTR